MHSYRGKDGLAGPTTPPCPGVVVGSPVRGNSPLLSARIGRFPVIPSRCGDCLPILHPAGSVQCLRCRVIPGPKMRSATSQTAFVPTIANVASPAPASVMSAAPMAHYLAAIDSGVSHHVSSLFRKASRQTERRTPMAYAGMKMPMPKATSPLRHSPGVSAVLGGLGLSVLRRTALPLGISRPAAGREARAAEGCPAGRRRGAEYGQWLIWICTTNQWLPILFRFARNAGVAQQAVSTRPGDWRIPAVYWVLFAADCNIGRAVPRACKAR